MGGLFSAPAPPPPPPLPAPPDPEASERERRQQISERQRRGRASTIVDKRFKGVLTETGDGTAPSSGATLTGKKRLGE